MTSEATGEIGLLVCGGMELTAKRTEKSEMVLRIFERELKYGGYKIIDGNLVSK